MNETSQMPDQPEDGAIKAPSLLARLYSYGSNLVMAGLIAVSGAGLYAMHVHTRTTTPASVKPSSAAPIGPQTVIAFERSLAETRRIVESMQTPGETNNTQLVEINNPFTYVRQRPPVSLMNASETAPLRADHAGLRAELAKLNLQSILCGRTNYCLINNELFTEGQTIGKFVIDRITSDAVHVRSNDFTFELKMNRR